MKKEKIIKLGVLFYLTSILGYLYELIIHYYYTNKIFSHGMLKGPWLPIYGIGALLISNLSKFKQNPLKIFVLTFFITGFFEGISGYLLLKIFKIRLWDYTGRFLNINGFVCFISALCFAIGGLIIIYLLMPLINKIVDKIDKKYIKITLILLSVVFSIDLFTSILKKLNI